MIFITMSMATAYTGRFGIRIGIDMPEAWHDDTRRVFVPELLIPFAFVAIKHFARRGANKYNCSSHSQGIAKYHRRPFLMATLRNIQVS